MIVVEAGLAGLEVSIPPQVTLNVVMPVLRVGPVQLVGLYVGQGARVCVMLAQQASDGIGSGGPMTCWGGDARG